MHVKKIVLQSGKDFTAVYECKYCGHVKEGYSYDDSNFHNNVISKMPCTACGKKEGGKYRLLTIKCPDHATV